MKKYLISIESANSDRLKKLYSQATFYNAKDEFKKFGVIGRNLSVSEYFQQGVAGKKKPMTPGELGCTLSHIAALRDFLNSDEQYAIIFEDDVIERFEVNFQDLEKHISSLNLETCFFLSLGGIQMKICNRVRGKFLTEELYNQKILKVDYDYLEKLAYAYAYIVDRKMAKMLVDYHQAPKIYDHWQDLVGRGDFSFYVSFLFDHPIIENNDALSYLEKERSLITPISQKNKDFLHYLKVKLKKCVLNKYII